MTPRSDSLAFVFPGQGSQSVGMLATLAAAHDEVRATFEEGSQGAGVDLWALSQQGPEEQLNRTEHTQPALLAASVAVWRVWQKLGGPQPAQLAGHSLGEYSALVCAGALSLHDACALVAERGRLMQAAVPPGVGAMAAILGMDDARIAEVCEEVAQGQVVSPANFNSPGQLVIAGNVEAVDRALARLSELGAKRAIKLAVSVPSHCALMREAAEQLGQRMQALAWQMPSIPVVQNAEARRLRQRRGDPRCVAAPAVSAGALDPVRAGAGRERGRPSGRVRPGQGAQWPDQAHRQAPGRRAPSAVRTRSRPLAPTGPDRPTGFTVSRFISQRTTQ